MVLRVSITPLKKYMNRQTTSYSDKLLDPRWQRKRLQIFERDKWTCRWCNQHNNTLVVHHKDYLPNKEPWEYPDNLLITLCQECHKMEQDRQETEQSLLHHLRGYFTVLDLAIIDNGLESLEDDFASSETYMLAEVIRWLCSDTNIREELSTRCWEMIQERINAKGRQVKTES